ncbi:MAG: response regulator [Lentimicrobium sp.]|nr:response regulator [Lentimicrobium sp.]
MKKQGQSEGVKGKVLSGFFLILTLALGAVFAVIQIATQLSPPDTGVSQSVIKLTLVSNMLSELIEANGQARAYINTGEKRYLARYRKLDKDIQKLADSLKYFSTLQPEQYKRMLVVDSLLKIKRGTMENFFRIRKADDTLALYQERLRNPVQKAKDSIGLANQTTQRASGDKQPSQVETNDESNQNFFKKIWNNITGKQQKKDTVQRQIASGKLNTDTLGAYISSGDTTIEMVKSQLLQMGEKERIDRQKIIDRDLLLLRTDQKIMDEIRNVFLLFEKEEINRAIEEAGHGRAVFRRLWYTAVVLAAVGLMTMIVFVILIWKDLARSSFYKRQLESARHLAEQLLKVKELFLANMSHEIRTPITGIIGFTERLSGTKLSKEQKNYLRYINVSSEHLLGLVDDLLDYSRIESGKLNLDSIPFLPADLFQQAFETLKHKAENKGLIMNYTTTLKSNQAVTADPLRIRQIVYNLLNNSLKFTEEGEVNFHTSSILTDNVLLLSFRVSDTGIGIPEEKQQEIFGEFTQVDVGITRKYGGSGLGLAICRKLVDLMKGDISLESKPGAGTTITVNLPLELYHGEIIESGRANPEATINLSGFRILLAEDDETTRILLLESLRSSGAVVNDAPDGAIAWSLFNDNSTAYDLVMTDIQMPNISGPELAEKIRKYSNANGISSPPVLGLTAHATSEDLELFREKGITEFLIKPYKQHQLAEALGKVLKINTINESGTINSEHSPGRELNLEAFLKFSDNDKEALDKILNSLADNLNKTSAEMQTAFEQGNYQQMALLAHRMLPNVRNLGAQDEAVLLQKLEALRRTMDINASEVSMLLISVRKGMAELENALRYQIGHY